MEDLARTFFIGNKTALYSYYRVRYAPPGYDDNAEDNKINPVYIKLFANIINAVNSPTSTPFYEYIGLFNQIDNIIAETIERIAYGAKICDERVAEGRFINTSLDTMRTLIKDILMKKHEQRGALYFSPNFIDECLVSYCPSGVNCFKTSVSMPPATRPSFNMIEAVGEGIISAKNKKEPTKDTKMGELSRIYNDLALCVFGVFNVSRLADNPPPVPYIDINNLKRLFYDSGDKYAADDMFRESYPVYGLLIDLKKLLEESNLTQSTFYKLLIEILTKNKGINDVVASALVESKTTGAANLYNKIKQLITEIDIHNAASSIGTLETLNTIAMLDVNTLCNKQIADDSKIDTSNRNLYFTADNSQINDVYKPMNK